MKNTRVAKPAAVAEPSPRGSTRPERSSALGYATWACSRLSALQRSSICARPRRFLSFCSGMASEVLASNAIVAGLDLQGNTLEVQHVAACELDDKKRAFLIQHYPEFGSVFKDVTDMKEPLILDEKSGDPVQRPEADVLVTGFSCKDISGLTTKPKSERGDNNGTSANTLRGTLGYIQACPWADRPNMVVLENAAGSVQSVFNVAMRIANFMNHKLRSLASTPCARSRTSVIIGALIQMARLAWQLWWTFSVAWVTSLIGQR